ncbi:MAG TPA: alpha-2-macroglobulin family protein [Oligoflexia bacterium]|nr:alpha-2-macroglobulin family protein [Oligoflexia bacterium]HMP47213.1 alpha-2-macroglobulin family protein [Oligoflexia bacterium]
MKIKYRLLKTLTRFLTFLVFYISYYPIEGNTEDSPSINKVIRISPSGDLESPPSQITIEFANEVVSLGEMSFPVDSPKGIVIKPDIPCSWKWISTRSLSCFISAKEKLNLATKYTVSIDKNLKLIRDLSLQGQFEQNFVTPRPKIKEAWLEYWMDSGRPLIKIALNTEVTTSSLEQNMFFKAEGLSINGKVNILTKKDLPSLNDDSYYDHYEEGYYEDGHIESRPTYKYYVHPIEPLPEDKAISLVVRPGVEPVNDNTEIKKENGIEDREIFSGNTFPSFTYTGISCSNLNGETIKFSKNHPEPTSACDPQSPVRITFSSPPDKSSFKSQLKINPAINLDSSLESYWDYGNSKVVRHNHWSGAEYSIYLPSGLKAESSYQINISPPEVASPPETWWEKILAFFKNLFTKQIPKISPKDNFGRILSMSPGETIETTFRTSRRKPNYELPNEYAVLEKNSVSDVPLYVNNIQSASITFDGITSEGKFSKKLHNYEIPKVENLQFAIPMSIRSLLNNRSGVIQGNVSTYPKIEKYNSKLFAQVTPFSIHFKIGHLNSLAWVTDLTTGLPVQNANVDIFIGSLSSLNARGKSIATAKTDQDGIAELPGSSVLDPLNQYKWAWSQEDKGLILEIKKEEDIAILPLRYAFNVSTYEISNGFINQGSRNKNQNTVAWGLTAQGIHRTGDRINYKLYLRSEGLYSLEIPEYRKIKITIKNPKDEVVHELNDQEIGDFGSFSGFYDIPKNAPTGWYTIYLTPEPKHFSDKHKKTSSQNAESDLTKLALQVLVSDFTPSPVKIELETLPSKTTLSIKSSESSEIYYLAGDQIQGEARVSLHSGGPFRNAEISTSLIIEASSFYPRNSSLRSFTFSSHDMQDGHGIQSHNHKINGTTKKDGKFEFGFNIPESLQFSYGVISLNATVKDDRGSQISTTKNHKFYGTSSYVGVKSPSWLMSTGKPHRFQTIVINQKEEILTGTQVEVIIEREEVVTAQVKSAGSAYLTRADREWKKVHSCSYKSAITNKENPEHSDNYCEFTPNTPGRYRAQAKVQDSKNRSHQSAIVLYAYGSGFTSWGNDSEYRLELVADKSEYKVGDVAKIMVKLPFEKAKGLISIERGGIMHRRLEDLDSSSSIVEVPIQEDSIPGIYLSVLAMLPRDKSSPMPEKIGDLDLGKPITKIGYINLPVKDRAKEIKVIVSTASENYRPGDEVPFEISLLKQDGNPFNEDAEVALTVIDESVLYLIKNKDTIFNIYDGMYATPLLEVKNYSLLTRLLGVQAFEKKGANPGGDGGSGDSDLREITSYIAHWDPNLIIKNGETLKGKIKLPDNLTSWRFVAVANSKNDKFGNGSTSIKSSKNLEIIPALPNQLTEGDQASGIATIFNRSDKSKNISFNAKSSEVDSLASETLSVDSFERKQVKIPINASSHDSISITMRAEEITAPGLTSESDGLRVKIPVYSGYMTEKTSQSGILGSNVQTKELSLNTNFETDTKTNPESLELIFTSNLLGDTSESFSYFYYYPYSCLEQKTSKTLAAAWHKGFLEDHANNQKQHSLFPQDLVPNYIKELEGLQSSEGGFSYYGVNSLLDDPLLSAFVAFALNSLEQEGFEVPARIKSKLSSFLDKAWKTPSLKNASLSPSEQNSKNASIAFGLSRLGEVDENEINRLFEKNSEMTVEARILLARALLTLNKTEKADIIIKGINNLLESTQSDASLKVENGQTVNLLGSSVTANCNLLGLLTERIFHSDSGEKPGGYLSDNETLIYKLASGIRKMRGSKLHWNTTQENILCLSAFKLADERTKIDYKKKSDSKAFPKIQITLGSDLIGTWPVDENIKSSFSHKLPLEFSKGTPESQLLRLRKLTPNPVFYQARLYHNTPITDLKASDSGISLKRFYSVLRNGTWHDIQKTEKVVRGDIIRIDLVIETPLKRYMLALKDSIPGALEPLRSGLRGTLDTYQLISLPSPHLPNLNTDGQDGSGLISGFQVFPHSELKDNLAIFYTEELWPGTYAQSYLASVISTGKFLAPNAIAEEMYSPEVFGRTDSLYFETNND